MENSYKFFSNKNCEYFPCHREVEEFNCLFCYCPLYRLPDCPGKPKYKEKDGRIVKVCIDCDFPHRQENYDKIMNILRKN